MKTKKTKKTITKPSIRIRTEAALVRAGAATAGLGIGAFATVTGGTGRFLLRREKSALKVKSRLTETRELSVARAAERAADRAEAKALKAQRRAERRAERAQEKIEALRGKIAQFAAA